MCPLSFSKRVDQIINNLHESWGSERQDLGYLADHANSYRSWETLAQEKKTVFFTFFYVWLFLLKQSNFIVYKFNYRESSLQKFMHCWSINVLLYSGIKWTNNNPLFLRQQKGIVYIGNDHFKHVVVSAFCIIVVLLREGTLGLFIIKS